MVYLNLAQKGGYIMQIVKRILSEMWLIMFINAYLNITQSDVTLYKTAIHSLVMLRSCLSSIKLDRKSLLIFINVIMNKCCRWVTSKFKYNIKFLIFIVLFTMFAFLHI